MHPCNIMHPCNMLSCSSVLLLAMVFPASARSKVANKPVASLDLSRYMGRWHEIAHLPMFFQRKCASEITATYTLRPDGNVTVRNACRTKTGDTDASEGIARPVNGRPAALEVRFAPEWLSWVPMVWADYWVVDLDPDYQWAVVGGPSRKYMWVLARSPTMAAALLEQIKARAVSRGYDLDKLVVAAPLE